MIFNFLRGALGYLEILHQFGKMVKAKSQKGLGANSYFSRSYRGVTGRWGLFGSPHSE